jgi:hypothetical protein
VASACTHGTGVGSATNASLTVSNTTTGGTLLHEVWADSAMETVRMAGDGGKLVAIASTGSSGGVSTGRVWSMDPASPSPREISMVAYSGHAQATCLSPSGAHLLVTTTYQSHRLLFYRVERGGVTQLANSSFPSFSGANYTSTYAATCRVSDAGEAVATFPLFRGFTTATQTAVAAFAWPAAAIAGDLAPAWSWISASVDASLQDIPSSDAMSRDGTFYAYASSGGLGGATRPPPPTLRVFQLGPSATPTARPIVEIVTTSPYRTTANATVSASLVALDLRRLAPTDEAPSECGTGRAHGGPERVLVLAVGLDAHMNTGSSGGMRYLWCVTIS